MTHYDIILSLFCPYSAQYKSKKPKKQALRDFIDFGRATLATVLAASVICKKTTSIITRRLQPIEEDAKILEGSEARLAKGNWVSEIV